MILGIYSDKVFSRFENMKNLINLGRLAKLSNSMKSQNNLFFLLIYPVCTCSSQVAKTIKPYNLVANIICLKTLCDMAIWVITRLD